MGIELDIRNIRVHLAFTEAYRVVEDPVKRRVSAGDSLGGREWTRFGEVVR